LEIFRNDKWAKSEAAMALGRLGRRESVPALVEWCLQEPSKWYDAERALEAMQDWNRVIGAMTGHLRAKDPSIRRQAITWLIRLRAREAATEIASMLRDPDFNVRSVAVRALGDLEARETAPNVLPLLEDPSRLIRRETLNTLGILGDAGMLQTIRKRVPLEHHSLRWDLALARFRLGDHESLPEFVEYLNHREAIVRADTVRWIGIMRAKKALPEVRRACQDADASVRMRSLEALSRIDPEGSVRSIVDALKDSDKSIVWEAIGLLGDLEAWDQAEEIRPLLKDVAIRVKAAEWLCEAGSWEGVDLLFSHHSHLKYLNALRAPEAWKRLKRVRVSRAELKGSLTDVLTTLGARAGVGFQRPDWPSAPQRRQMELQRRNWSSWNRDVFDGSSESSLGWLKTILFREDLEFIIQDNRICVFPEEEVEAAWASWIKDNRPKHK
jgi:HEAT repeat protein